MSTEVIETAWGPVEPEPLRVCVAPGLYRFRGIRGKTRGDGTTPWIMPPCEVSLIGVGRHVHRYDEQLAFVVGGLLRFCGLEYWSRNFEPVAPQQPDQPKPEPQPEPAIAPRKVAGRIAGGNQA